MCKPLTIFILIITIDIIALGQAIMPSGFHLEVQDSTIVDNEGNSLFDIPVHQRRTTNFNPSIDLSDSVLTFLVDSLRTDGTATIMTVYETDDTGTVGLWQIGSDKNRALWLNSKRASYEKIPITYRATTEQGVIIHTMLYRYPRTDSSYNGHDTLYLGSDGSVLGDKNYCAWLYYPGKISYLYQRQMESALAIRYGALLHGPYINSLGDTLWNPLGSDSLHSSGVCGIGRDDSLSLLQSKSSIRGCQITLESLGTFDNLTHVMMGHDGGGLWFGDDVVWIDTIAYAVIERQWKLRVHSRRVTEQIRIGADLIVPTQAVRLMLSNIDGSEIILPKDTDSIMFDSITLNAGQDYLLSLLIDPTVFPDRTGDAKGSLRPGKNDCDQQEPAVMDFRLTVHPNPTRGRYTADVRQSAEGIIGIQVTDVAGRIIEQYTTEERLTQYQHTGILGTDGVYYVTVSSNGSQKTLKVIVTK